MTTWWALRSTTKPLGEVALRIDHMVGIAIHHKAVRRGGHCELTTWWALRSTTKPLGEVALRIDHMVGIAIHHKAVRRGGHCELTTWWALRIKIILEEHPRET